MISEPKRDRRRVADLLPADYNPRSITAEALNGLKASLQRFGLVQPIIVNDTSGNVVGGHQRLKVLQADGVEEIDVVVVELSDGEERALNVALNNQAIGGEFTTGLQALLAEVRDFDGELFDDLLLGELLADADAAGEAVVGETDPDEIPVVERDAVTVRGDVWHLGEHRVMCGDSTSANDVGALLAGLEPLAFLQADPPYGMGKEADGVANDNLYASKLDDFQTAWWRAWSPHLKENSSVMVWGTAEDLWRWWWTQLVNEPGTRVMRNEIVWDKNDGMGMGTEAGHMYATTTERALFFMTGQQMLGNLNKDDYFEGFEPLRVWMNEQREANGWTKGKVNEITGTHMAGHWFSKSQFAVINEERYNQLRAVAEAEGVPGFRAPFSRVAEVLNDGREGFTEHVRGIVREMRSYFDNQHAIMRDVWQFKRVIGEEREGHATPKPVAMIEQAIKTSCPADELVGEPFGGSGSTLIAAESTGRQSATMELIPQWVDVIVRRWEAFTGREARLGEDGPTYAEVVELRAV